MGIGVGLGAFAQGLAGGLKTASDLQDAQERRELAREQNARENERLGFERERANRESQIFGYTLKDLQRKSADADIEDQAKNLFLEADGLIKPQTTATASAAAPTTTATPKPAQAIAAPVNADSANATSEPTVTQAVATPTPVASRPMPQGISLGQPAQQAAPADQPGEAPKSNPFIMPLKGPDLDRYYDLKAKALQMAYVAKGDFDKAMQVPKMMRDLREQNWSDKVGAAMSAAASGAPGAIRALDKVYSLVDDGYDLDVKASEANAKFDPTKGLTGLVRVNKETGKSETFDLSPTQAAVIANRYKDPAAVIQYIQGRQDIAFNQNIESRKAAAEETKAAASSKTADAAMIKAKADKTYSQALQQANTDLAKSRNENEAYGTFSKMFGVSDFQFKTESQVKAMLPDQKTEYENARAQQQYARGMANVAGTLWNLNERKVAPTLIGQAVQEIMARRAAGKGPDGFDDKSGLAYITIGGQKVLFPKE